MKTAAISRAAKRLGLDVSKDGCEFRGVSRDVGNFFLPLCDVHAFLPEPASTDYTPHINAEATRVPLEDVGRRRADPAGNECRR